MASEAIVGPCFSPGMVTEFWFTSRPNARIEINIHWHQWFQVHMGNHVKEQLTQAGLSFALYLVFLVMPAKSVCPPHSKSAHSHLNLFYVRIVKFVLAWICADDMRVSCLQAKGRRHHLIQRIDPAVTGSAGPASRTFQMYNACNYIRDNCTQ